MSENVIRSTIRDYVNQCWNSRNMAKLKTISTDNFTRTANGVKVANSEKEMEEVINVFFTGFPDLKVAIENPIIKDNQSFTHWTFTGTNSGKFGVAPPTGKKVNISGTSTATYNDDGKIIQEIVYFNELELMTQLGYTLTPPL